MDYLSRWTEIRSRLEPHPALQAAVPEPDPLAALFAEVDRHLHEDAGTELEHFEERVREECHALSSRLNKLFRSADDAARAASAEVQASLQGLFEEFCAFVHLRLVHLAMGDDHPLNDEFRPLPPELTAD